MTLYDAANITCGYQAIVCETKSCTNTAWVPPWYVPYGGYCEVCKKQRKDEAREDEFQDKVLENRYEQKM